MDTIKVRMTESSGWQYVLSNSVITSNLEWHLGFLSVSHYLGQFAIYNFDQENDFCISEGSVVTFFRCGGKMHKHLCQISSEFHIQKLLQSVHFWLSYSRNNKVVFWTTYGVVSSIFVWNNAFRKIFNTCWRESTRSLQFYCDCLPVPYLIDQCRMLFWKKMTVSSNRLLLVLSSCLLYTSPSPRD